MKAIIVFFVATFTGLSAYDGFYLHKRLGNLQTRLTEVEDRITLQDEARIQIQRLALEQLKERKRIKCQSTKPPRLSL